MVVVVVAVVVVVVVGGGLVAGGTTSKSGSRRERRRGRGGTGDLQAFADHLGVHEAIQTDAEVGLKRASCQSIRREDRIVDQVAPGES